MIELTLLTLLNYVGDNFCKYRNLEHDNYKSLLLSYSDASYKFGPLEVKKVIEKSENFKVAAVAVAAIKVPSAYNSIMKFELRTENENNSKSFSYFLELYLFLPW